MRDLITDDSSDFRSSVTESTATFDESRISGEPPLLPGVAPGKRRCQLVLILFSAACVCCFLSPLYAFPVFIAVMKQYAEEQYANEQIAKATQGPAVMSTSAGEVSSSEVSSSAVRVPVNIAVTEDRGTEIFDEDTDNSQRLGGAVSEESFAPRTAPAGPDGHEEPGGPQQELPTSAKEQTRRLGAFVSTPGGPGKGSGGANSQGTNPLVETLVSSAGASRLSDRSFEDVVAPADDPFEGIIPNDLRFGDEQHGGTAREDDHELSSVQPRVVGPATSDEGGSVSQHSTPSFGPAREGPGLLVLGKDDWDLPAAAMVGGERDADSVSVVSFGDLAPPTSLASMPPIPKRAGGSHHTRISADKMIMSRPLASIGSSLTSSSTSKISLPPLRIGATSPPIDQGASSSGSPRLSPRSIPELESWADSLTHCYAAGLMGMGFAVLSGYLTDAIGPSWTTAVGGLILFGGYMGLALGLKMKVGTSWFIRRLC